MLCNKLKGNDNVETKTIKTGTFEKYCWLHFGVKLFWGSKVLEYTKSNKQTLSCQDIQNYQTLSKLVRNNLINERDKRNIKTILVIYFLPIQ